MLKYNNAELPQ